MVGEFVAPCAISRLEDISTLEQELRVVVANGSTDECVEFVMKLFTAANAELEVRRQRIRALLSRTFGRSAERHVPGQLLIDFMARLLEDGSASQGEAPSDSSLPQEDGGAAQGGTSSNAGSEEKESVEERKRARRGRRNVAELSLQREVELVSVRPEDRVCQCGHARHSMGHREVSTIEIRPVHAWLRVQQLERMGCRGCGTGVVEANPSGVVKPGCRAGASLLAHVATAKAADFCPTYRQHSILARGDLHIPKSTLDDYFAEGGELAEPISKILRTQTLCTNLLSTDDTRLLALGKEQHGGTRKGRLWCMLGDVNRVGFYRFTRDWKQTSFSDVLKGFSGSILQGDAYAGYACYGKARPDIIIAGCMDHARRRFVEALKHGDARAGPILALVWKLYKLEAHLKKQNSTHSETVDARQRISVPIFGEIARELDVVDRSVTPRTLLADAVTYMRNQWEALRVYTRFGEVPISNVHTERDIKPVALLRKNSLFAGSVAGAHRLAHVLTLVLNCRLVGICPFSYLSSVFRLIIDGWPSRRIAELTPRAWSVQQPSQ